MMNRILFASKWGGDDEVRFLLELDILLAQQYNQALSDAIYQIDNELPFHCTTTECIEELKTLKK